MNQIMLKVNLYAESEDDDILSFVFEEEEGKVYLNSDSCQKQMKGVFSKLIKLSVESDIEFTLEIAEGYGRGLYKDVCKEYVNELKRELDSVKEQIRREMDLSKRVNTDDAD